MCTSSVSYYIVVLVYSETVLLGQPPSSNIPFSSLAKGAGCKTYYLTADSQPIMEEWVRVLQNVVQRNALKLLLSQEDQKPTVQVFNLLRHSFFKNY